MTKSEDGSIGVPFCSFKNLNYSNVINLRTKKVSERKYKKLNTSLTPNMYNVSYKFLSDDELVKHSVFLSERESLW